MQKIGSCNAAQQLWSDKDYRLRLVSVYSSVTEYSKSEHKKSLLISVHAVNDTGLIVVETYLKSPSLYFPKVWRRTVITAIRGFTTQNWRVAWGSEREREDERRGSTYGREKAKPVVPKSHSLYPKILHNFSTLKLKFSCSYCRDIILSL